MLDEEMTRAKTVTFVAVPCIIVAAAAFALIDNGRTSYPAVAAPYPKTWLQVRPGMISDDARKLIGEPWADGRDLKILDRWRTSHNGVELHLDVWFENPKEKENDHRSVITGVVRWKRFLGREYEVHSDPPMQ